jgi:sugar lactone lactonase YvrE
MVEVVIDPSAGIERPFGLDWGPDGTIYVVDFTSKVWAVKAGTKPQVICGGKEKGDSGDGGPSAEARVNTPHSLAIGPSGDLYLADTMNHRVRKIDARAGIISTVAGTTKGFSGDGGPANRAQFSGVYCIAFSPDQSRLVITDLDNRRIRVMQTGSGLVTTIAGNGSKGVPKDGEAAVEQPLVDPRAAAMDSKGNVYILERGGHALRLVDAAGKIRTLVPGPAGKDGKRVLNGPKHLCIDRNDDVIIADTDNHRIVKWVASQQKLVTLAGTGKAGNGAVGGPAETVELNQPHGVFVDKDGVLFVCDSWNGRVLRVR